MALLTNCGWPGTRITSTGGSERMDLVQLSRKKFGKLTRADIKLFKAVAAG